MTTENITVAPSTPLAKALHNGNSFAPDWQNLDILQAIPTSDGIVAAGHAGSFAPDRIKILPYCDGQPGAQFSVRIYGWDVLNPANSGSQQPMTWIPVLLAELLCTACSRASYYTLQQSTGALISAENLCDTITLTQGSLGQNGAIVSTGPGTNLVAFAKVDLAGCRYFQFDFNQTDPVGMNCLWGRC